MADFDTLKAWAIEDWKAQGEWREAVEDEFAFFAGHQWTDAETAELERNQRVPIVFNRVAVIIAAVTGVEINGRTEVRFIPRTIGDAEVNEVLTAGAEWFRDQASAEDEESEAFSDAVICGMGWTETSLDFEEDEEGQPVIKRIEPNEMAWDCHAQAKGLGDASRVHRVREIPRREALSMFPDFDPGEIHVDWLGNSGEDATKHITFVGDQYAQGEGEIDDNSRKVLRIVQTQWRERERVIQFALPGMEKPVEMTPGKFERILKMMPMIPHRRITRHVWKQAFLGRDGILKENQPCPDEATFKAITGHWDRKDKRFYGLIRMMRDPQKFANKWLSQVLHIIGSNAKGGVMAEQDATDDHRGFEESWAASDSVNWLRPGAISQGKIQPKPSVQMPVALMQLTEFATNAIRDASGVNMELLGLRDSNQPGVLEYQRKQAAMTTLARFFDAMRYYRKRQGRVILHFLREHIAPTGRLVRIVEEGQQRYVPLAMDDETTKYDVIVDDAPQAPNQKERNWEIMQPMLALFADRFDADDWAMVAEHSPLPTAFVERIKQKAAEAKEAPPNPMQELEVAKLESEVAENQAQAEHNRAKAQQIAVEAGFAPMRMNIDGMEAEAKLLQAMTPGPSMRRPGASQV